MGYKLNWIDFEFPFTCYVVEVRYNRGGQGDIAVSEIRCNELPKERSNEWGFTEAFWNYETARRYARHVAAELGIPAVV